MRLCRKHLLGFAIGVASMVLAPLGTASGSEPFNLDFDGAMVETGEIGGATFDGPDEPVAVVRLSNSGGVLSGAAEGFEARDWYSGTSQPVDIGMSLESTEPIDGRFAPETGSLEFSSAFRIEFFQMSADVPNERQSCVTEPFDISFSTDVESRFVGMPKPFSEGIDGAGSVWGTWSALPDATGEGWCENPHFDQLMGVGSAGGIMLTRARKPGQPDPPPDPDPPHEDPPGIDPPSLAEPDLRLRIRSEARSGRGRGVSALVEVVNRGGSAGRVRLCFRTAPRSWSVGKKCRSWKSLAGQAKRKVKLRLRPMTSHLGRVKLDARLTIGGKTVATKQRTLRAR